MLSHRGAVPDTQWPVDFYTRIISRLCCLLPMIYANKKERNDKIPWSCTGSIIHKKEIVNERFIRPFLVRASFFHTPSPPNKWSNAKTIHPVSS